MFWLMVLSIVFLGVGAIVFVLARDAFRESRVRRETPPAVSLAHKNGDAAAINSLMRENIHAPPPPPPAALFAGQHGKEADAVADTLAHVKQNLILPTAPKAYLRFEEHDDSLDRLLIQRVRGQGEASRPREFSIGVTEKNEAPLECEKEMFRSATGQKGKKA